MLWFGSWLTGDDGSEGQWFYSGRGGESQTYAVPAWASGLRVRRWPNEGFDAEYFDLTDLESLREVAPTPADFDEPQRFSRLSALTWR